jgi:hypothetical protein
VLEKKFSGRFESSGFFDGFEMGQGNQESRSALQGQRRLCGLLGQVICIFKSSSKTKWHSSRDFRLLRLHLFIRGEKFDVVKVEKKSGKDNKSKGKKNEAEAQVRYFLHYFNLPECADSQRMRKISVVGMIYKHVVNQSINHQI